MGEVDIEIVRNHMSALNEFKFLGGLKPENSEILQANSLYSYQWTLKRSRKGVLEDITSKGKSHSIFLQRKERKWIGISFTFNLFYIFFSLAYLFKLYHPLSIGYKVKCTFTCSFAAAKNQNTNSLVLRVLEYYCYKKLLTK